MKKLLIIPLIGVFVFTATAATGFNKNLAKISSQAEPPSAASATMTAADPTSKLETVTEPTGSIPSEKIYTTMGVHASWAVDPTDTADVTRRLQKEEAFAIVKVKVSALKKPEFHPDNEKYSGIGAVIPIEVEVLDVLDGKKIGGSMTLYMSDNKALIKDMIPYLEPESVLKMGVDDLSEEEKNTLYISMETDFCGESYDYTLIKDHEYVLIISYPPKANEYLIYQKGYGVFEATDGKTYKNVITGNPLEF